MSKVLHHFQVLHTILRKCFTCEAQCI